MQLKIEHIAKRLPYGLKMVGCQSELTPKILQRWVDGDWDIEPILFPLSALTQEITIKGIKFTPIDWIYKRYTSRLEWQKIPIETFRRLLLDAPYELPYWAYEILLEYHFDVDYLIESNLAISVFDLPENPYE